MEVIVKVHFCQDKKCTHVETRTYELTSDDICDCMDEADPVVCLAEKVLDIMAHEWCRYTSKAEQRRKCMYKYKAAQGMAAWDSIVRGVDLALRELAVSRVKR